jgi:hypothetical protein
MLRIKKQDLKKFSNTYTVLKIIFSIHNSLHSFPTLFRHTVAIAGNVISMRRQHRVKPALKKNCLSLGTILVSALQYKLQDFNFISVNLNWSDKSTDP